jgi:TrmH family RNA methyltransferase
MKLSKARHALLQRLRQRKQREREGCFVVEGVRSARAVLEAGLPVRFAVMSPRLAGLDADGALAERLSRARFDVVAISDQDLAALAGTMTPQGILLVCDEPRAPLDRLATDAGGVLVADAVQDPANLGAMIRSAAAFGLAGLVALDGTVDPWNAKVVRGSAGASFRLPIAHASCAELLDWIERGGIRLLAGDIGGLDVAAADKSLPWALAIGNEGAGLRAELRAATRGTVTVPIRGDADALNAGVAAAILCYELSRGTPS